MQHVVAHVSVFINNMYTTMGVEPRGDNIISYGLAFGENWKIFGDLFLVGLHMFIIPCIQIKSPVVPPPVHLE